MSIFIARCIRTLSRSISCNASSKCTFHSTLLSFELCNDFFFTLLLFVCLLFLCSSSFAINFVSVSRCVSVCMMRFSRQNDDGEREKLKNSFTKTHLFNIIERLLCCTSCTIRNMQQKKVKLKMKQTEKMNMNMKMKKRSEQANDERNTPK